MLRKISTAIVFLLITNHVVAQVTLPYSQSFDQATTGNPGTLPTGWLQGSEGTNTQCNAGPSDCFDWTVNSGGTASGNTGPSSDHTTQSGNYVFVEASGNANDSVLLYTPPFNLNGFDGEINFWAHSYNGNDNQEHELHIDIVSSDFTIYHGRSLIVIGDTNIDNWLQYTVDLSTYSNLGEVRVVFRRVLGITDPATQWRHDIAVDDVLIEVDYCSVGDNYNDEFASASYNNSNGSTNWTPTPWTELNDGGDASNNANAGEIRIVSGQLRLTNSTGFNEFDPTPAIRRAVDLSSAQFATLSFDYAHDGNLEPTDVFEVRVYDGSSWTVLFSRTDDFTTGRVSIDISPYANSNTEIEFRIASYYGASDEFLRFDNIEICYTEAPEISDFSIEAECEYIGSKWAQLGLSTASNQKYVTPKIGQNSLASPPADTNSYLTYTINIIQPGNYQLYGRIVAPTSDDDSFWVRVDGGAWYRWDNLSATSWTWRQVWDSDNGDNTLNYVLSTGVIKIDIAFREDGVQLDKLYLTKGGGIPTGIGPSASNCSSSLDDPDGDGIPNDEDLDDDNDGILDVDESLSSIDFSGTRTHLSGTGTLTDLDAGDKVLYAEAIRSCTDILYDIVITINTISPGVIVSTNSNGLDMNNVIPSQNDFFTYTISVVQAGSATPGNPTGTPVSVPDFTLGIRDIDSNTGNDYTEVVGYTVATAPTSTYFASPTLLEVGGFLSGGPSGSWTLYRQDALTGTTNWTNNGNIPSSQIAPEIELFLQFDNFSEVELVFGVTGSHSTFPDNPQRATRFGASSECDRDGDGIPNRIDLDLDNDGIFDLIEAGHGQADADLDGRIDGATSGSGANGIFDGIETSAESGTLNFTYTSSDDDNLEDSYDLDSDGDGCFDTEEADVLDPEPDGTAGSGTATADVNGLVISIVYQVPPTTSWQDSLSACTEICDNGLDDDGDGDVDEDDADCANYFLEAECGVVGSNWELGLDPAASNGDYTSIMPGLNATTSAPAGAANIVSFQVFVTVAGNYRILGRVLSATGADDSFWVRVDGGTWYYWNDWNTAALWEWIPITDNMNGNTLLKWPLTAGNHTIDIAYGEDGAQLDKLHLTINGTTPDGLGSVAINCARTITTNFFLPYKLLNK